MTPLSCVSVAGCRASLSLLERLSYSPEDLARRLPSLRARSGASGLAVLSTCQRVEVYASWPGAPDTQALLRALAEDRGVAQPELEAGAVAYLAEDAARHLLRVATGLESFVLGETEIAGQVRASAAASRSAQVTDLELDRLLAAAVSASRHTRRATSLAQTGRSVATAAVETVAGWHGGSLAGQRVLVVGAGSVATAVVARAAALGASLTVSNRTRRHAERFALAGARVVDLAELGACLRGTDVAILATAAPHPLVDAATLRRAQRPAGAPLVLFDLCLPRNVDPSVGDSEGVRLVDLADLRAAGSPAAEAFADDVARTGHVVELELGRYLRWRTARAAVTAARHTRHTIGA